jgi:hypothetical protein
MSFRLSAYRWLALSTGAALLLALAPAPIHAQDDASTSSSSPAVTSPPNEKDYQGSSGFARLKIVVLNDEDKPVGNASVYVRYPKPGTLFHHDQLAELDLKSNMDGSVRVPPVPRGKVQVQVIAKGWHTFGEWYDLEEPGTLTIHLKEPPHWY